MMHGDPQPILRRWLPHVLMLGAIVASIVLLAYVVAPLFEPILLAAALAMLTSPVVFEPIDRLFTRWFPRVEQALRRRMAGVVATALLAVAIVTPLALLVVAAVGSVSDVLDLGLGIVMRSPEQLDRIEELVRTEVVRLDELFPKLRLGEVGIAEGVRRFLAEALDMSSAFLSFIASGTGAVAQLALAIIALAFFYVEGPRIVRATLHYSPLREDQQTALLRTHRATVLRLLNDTVATAVAKGVLLGGIIWLVTRLLVVDAGVELPFLPVAIVAGVITLLPLVGVTVVWLPLAGFLWTRGEHVAAVELAILCWGGNFLLDNVRERISRRIDEGSSWRSFLLFVGLVGGLLSYGMKGLIIGPMAVVLVSTVCSAWLPLYGGDREEPEPPDGGGDDAAEPSGADDPDDAGPVGV